MAIVRPAGLSDEDSSDDDYGYFQKPKPRSVQFDSKNALRIYEGKLKGSIINGEINDFKIILKNDLDNDVNIKLDSGWTPLLHACFQGQEQIVKYLLDAGALPNLSADSVTPVMMACSNSTTKESTMWNIVNMLIEKHCTLNVGDKYGLTALMRAACGGRLTIVKLILTKSVNVDMRDEKGWTALFWAVHCNQPECVNILLSKGAEAKLVDTYGRTPADIADAHGFEEIHNIIQKHLHSDDDIETLYTDEDISDNCEWQNYYPGVTKTVPNYSNEVYHLLEGMNCKRLRRKFRDRQVDLRTFLLMEEEDLINLGIDMPYERQRILTGIRKFHAKGWTLNSVAGLYVGKSKNNNNYKIIECLSVLGSHLQQLYILETTLAYVLRDYNRLRARLDAEPPDSPTIKQLNDAVKKMIANVNNIRKEINSMKSIHKKINDESLRPADLITEKTTFDVTKKYVSKLLVICGMGILAKGYILKMFA